MRFFGKLKGKPFHVGGLRVRFFGRIRKRICDPRSYGFFDTKETQNPKKDYFVMTRQAGGTQYINQAPVVQKLDSAIHRVNLYPVDNAIGFPNTYPLDSDLSGG